MHSECNKNLFLINEKKGKKKKTCDWESIVLNSVLTADKKKRNSKASPGYSYFYPEMDGNNKNLERGVTILTTLGIAHTILEKEI